MTESHRFDPTILREYDIRGVVGRTLHSDDAYALGRSFATVMRSDGASSVAVGYDGRLSSPEMEAALVEGLSAGGVEVVRVGRGPTPMLYFACHHLPSDAGIMVTGSHNPPDHNGFKLVLRQASFFGPAIQELGRIAEDGDWAEGEGEAREQSVFDPYVERLIGTIRREFLDHVVFWNGRDLERKLSDFEAYYNAVRSHASLEGHTPLEVVSGRANGRAEVDHVRWAYHCRGLVQLPVAA